jgi:hypothetical protein
MNVAIILHGFASRKRESYPTAMNTLEYREAGKCLCCRTNFPLRFMQEMLRGLLEEFISITMRGFIHISPIVTGVAILFGAIKNVNPGRLILICVFPHRASVVAGVT